MKRLLFLLFVFTIGSIILISCFVRIGTGPNSMGEAVIVNSEGFPIGTTRAYYTDNLRGRMGTYVLVEKMPDGTFILWQPE